MARIDEIIARKAEIRSLINTEGADFDVDALTAEVRALDEEAQQIEARAAHLDALRNTVGTEARAAIEKKQHTAAPKSREEVRSSAQYVDAYVKYIKTENAAECRALLSENATDGTVPVPVVVEDIVRTAWDKEEIMSRVPTMTAKGNVKISFEIDGDDAVIHTEGGAAVTEEDLDLGIVELVPVSIKKWVSFSDEVMDMRGEAFLRYIFEELTHRIAKKAADLLVSKIVAAPTTSTATAPAVGEIEATSISLDLIAQALGMLSDEAANPVVIINKATWAKFKAAQYAANFPVDPFEGLPVLYNNTELVAFDDADEGDAIAIIGDLRVGAVKNLPNGEGITLKVDETTLMTSDLVRVLGRQYIATEVVAPNAFVRIVMGDTTP